MTMMNLLIVLLLTLLSPFTHAQSEVPTAAPVYIVSFPPVDMTLLEMPSMAPVDTTASGMPSIVESFVDTDMPTVVTEQGGTTAMPTVVTEQGGTTAFPTEEPTSDGDRTIVVTGTLVMASLLIAVTAIN
jgi:hypothetical protein